MRSMGELFSDLLGGSLHGMVSAFFAGVSVHAYPFWDLDAVHVPFDVVFVLYI